MSKQTTVRRSDQVSRVMTSQDRGEGEGREGRRKGGRNDDVSYDFIFDSLQKKKGRSWRVREGEL